MRAGKGSRGLQGAIRTRTHSVRFVATALVGVLVAILVLSSAASLVARLRVANAQNELRNRWIPAQDAAIALEAAYTDEETGQRGFLLTGDPTFLQPYDSGSGTAVGLQNQLAALLRNDPVALGDLHQVTAAMDAWTSEAAEPQIAERRKGPIDPAQLDPMALRGKQLFDIVRAKLTVLHDRTGALASLQLRRIDQAQSLATIITIVTVALAALVAVLAVPVLARVLTRPLRRLLGSVQRVAKGDYQAAIVPEGPAEIQLIAGAVERMRQSILEHSRNLVESREELTLRDERDRLAADLHDLSIQRLFALGLSMSAAASRNPEMRAVLHGFVDETDRIIRELRGIIFDISHAKAPDSLRAGVGALVNESSRALGFSPSVEFRGPVDQATSAEITEEMLAVLREALSNVARHAHASRAEVVVSAGEGLMRLSVADDGNGLAPSMVNGNGIVNMQARAARLGGEASVTSGTEGGTTLSWTVPLAS